MLNELFSSEARVKILKLFLFNSKNRFYQREIASRTNLAIRAVQRETENLEKIGIIKRSEDGNRAYYAVDESCTVIPELKALFAKTSGVGDIIKQHLTKQGNELKFVFIYGSYAKNTENMNSDIDLFVVGNMSAKKLSSITSEIADDLKREVNYTLFSEEEFKMKLMQKNHFVANVIKNAKVFVVGGVDDLEEFVKGRKIKAASNVKERN